MKGIIIMITLTVFISSCLMSSVVTIPMRVTSAVIGVIPIVGDSIERKIDGVADDIDTVGEVADIIY